MLSNLMKTVGAFLTGLGGVYVGQHIAGELSFWAFIAFAVGLVLLSQAPTIALRERLLALEVKSNSSSSVERH